MAFEGMAPETVKDTAAAMKKANRVAADALATLVIIRSENDAISGGRADRLRQSLEPAIRRTERSTQVADTLVTALLGQIDEQNDASKSGLTRARGQRGLFKEWQPPRRPAGPTRTRKGVLLSNSYGTGEGMGAGTPQGMAHYYDPRDRRHRSPFAPTLQALARLTPTNPGTSFELYFAGSSGAETRDVVCEQREQPKGASPWQVNPAQLFQIPPDAEFIVAELGGNDALFGPVIREAHGLTTSSAFEAKLAEAKKLLADRDESGREFTEEDYRRQAASAEVGKADTLVARWLQIIQEIRARAPHATIVLTNYPEAVDPKVLDEESALISFDQADRIKRDLAEGLNRALGKVVELAGPGVVLADVSQTLKGHEVYTKDPWINGKEAYDDEAARDNFGRYRVETWAENEAFHPNGKGYGAIAQPIANSLANVLGLQPPVQPPEGHLTRPGEGVKVIQGFSDVDGDGIADSQDPSPGNPKDYFKGLVNCPPPLTGPGALPKYRKSFDR